MILFLDRDGVLNRDDGYTHVFKPEIVFPDVRFLAELDVEKIFVVTNQSGISRGYYTAHQFHMFMKEMIEFLLKEFGVFVDDYFFCPHLPGDSDCFCRKPKPGLFTQAKNKYGLCLKKSLMVGDKISDIEAGYSAGISRNFLLRRGTSVASMGDESLTRFSGRVINALSEIRIV